MGEIAVSEVVAQKVETMTASHSKSGRTGWWPTRPRPVDLLITLLAAAAVPVCVLVERLDPVRGQSGGPVSWVVLAAVFAVAEIFVVHVHVRRDSHSFSMAEVPLVLGLMLVTPGVLLVAAVSGVGAALVFHRRQHLSKVVFNLSKLVVEVGLTVAVARTLDVGAGVPNNHDAVGVFGATLACSLAGAVLVSLVIAMSQSSWKGVGFVSTLPMSLFGTLTSTSFGLVAVTMMRATPSTIWLLVVPVSGCFGVYLAWSKQSRRLESLGYLYRTAQLLQEHASIDDAVLALLAETRELLKSRSVELVYRRSPDAPAMHAKFTSVQGGEVESADEDFVQALITLTHTLPGASLLRVADHQVLGTMFRLDAGVCLVAPMVSDGVAVGALLVGPPLSEVAQFDEDERQLVETTASALSVSLQNGSLERSLGQLRTLEQQMSHQAFHDSLTQLPNRAQFIRSVADVASETAATSSEFALLFIDLDDFKTVNDSLGHAAGDALLVEVGARIGRCLRPGDLAARLGGDEFAVLLPDVADPRIAATIANRILESLNDPVMIGPHRVSVSASIGVALSDGETDPTKLLEGADVAMYSAKAAGKGQAVSFHAAMREDMVSRHQLLQDIQGAAGRNELFVEYQPIVSLQSGRVESAEALIRWDHPERGRIPPDEFIHLAEENRAIRDITALILADACAQLARHDPSVLPRVNINVSSRDLDSADFADNVARALSDHRVAPDRLVCEVTESLVLGGDAVKALGALRNIGVKLSLDDFGTGYSSLHMLRDLPLDQLKIAQTFIDDIEVDPQALAFVQAIATLGATLGLDIVAEGVERPGQAAALRQAGCSSAQGYVFARPAPSDDLARRLHDVASRHESRTAAGRGGDGLADWFGQPPTERVSLTASPRH